VIGKVGCEGFVEGRQLQLLVYLHCEQQKGADSLAAASRQPDNGRQVSHKDVHDIMMLVT
jgi:hypothetical protein